ncbi:MAG: NAD(P)H-dependent oxidoreductase [Candidatus Bilamarchaeum sp.]
MNFKEIVMSRYAVKSFDGKKVDQKKVDELIEMIRFSPSSFNIQPWKIKVVTDQAVKDKLMAASWNQPQVGSASHVLILCADTNVEVNIDRLEASMLKAGASKESIAGYMSMMRGFAEKLQGEARKNWAQKQVYIALANALNGAKALGFDSCPMEGFDPNEYSKILNLPKNIVATVVCPIGFASDTARPKMRFPKADIVF